ncbi:unnamed protein product, partial [Schistosoma mattheei]
MVVGGSRQETMDPGFVLLSARQQGVPVILRDRIRQGAPVPSSLQACLADENAALAFPILAFTSTSDPPCPSMMLL